jgi:hypothetical protein
MSPGGGGEPNAPTAANTTADVNCSLYSKQETQGGLLLPAPPFWLPVKRTSP